MEMARSGQAKAPGGPCVLIRELLSCVAGLCCGNGGNAGLDCIVEMGLTQGWVMMLSRWWKPNGS